MTLADLLLAGEEHSDSYYSAVDALDAAGVAEVLLLVSHPEPSVRRAVTLTLPLLTHGDPPSDDLVAAALALSLDPDDRVRDYACFALGEQWREVDTPEVRAALAARLDDDDRDARHEALVGLAYRQDPRALPRVRAALSRPDGDVWLLELVAAGALSDPGLHPLVLEHQDGWDDEHSLRTADAARRLTDPEGPGPDVIDSVAELYRRRAHGLEDGPELEGWHLMDLMLDIAPYRAEAFFLAVLDRLAGDPAALDEFRTRSALAQLVTEGP